MALFSCCLMLLGLASGGPATVPTPIWVPPGIADDADSYVAFRGEFRTRSSDCRISLTGASEYLVWLDGKLIEDGPVRYSIARPQYQTLELKVAPGAHLLSIEVHNDGVATRMLPEIPPFLWCEVHENGQDLPVTWKCARVPGYQPRVRRISNILGWIEWRDANFGWPDWQQEHFDDSAWLTPVRATPGIGVLTEAGVHPTRLYKLPLTASAGGKLAQRYGYESDDPPVRFALADLNPESVPSQGIWRRYDLSRVRLGRADFLIDAPKGTVIEFGLSEQLRNGRVEPWITLSGSTSCNMDRFVCRGGPEEFMPFSPKGGRYLEVHVTSTGPVRFLKESFLERTYYGAPTGSFACSDPLLNKIWSTGLETTRACADDTLIDCPTRERGEWTGDVATVAMDNCAVAYSDLSLARRALVQAAESARADGLVAGLMPGQPEYVSTYAALWTSACVHYWELTGDKSLLVQLLPAAEANMRAFEEKLTPNGLQGDLGWEFVDWGYVPNSGPSDMALNIDFLMALNSMRRWYEAVGALGDAGKDEATAKNCRENIVRWIQERISAPGGWANVGYHRAALALLAGLVGSNNKSTCINSIESHLLECFPNDQQAPRLADPSVSNDHLMTPFFCHFALAALLEQGETAFVLGQYRKCWGWALAQGWTTWPEVFDPRWSLCHGWSGCPTWQLSRYVLGLQPRLDLGPNVYDLRIQTGGLSWASGEVPMPGGGAIHVEWKSERRETRVTLRTPRPIILRINGKRVPVQQEYRADMAS